MPLRLLSLFRTASSNAADGLTQPEREAILDALHLVIYADKHLSLAEDRAVDDWAEQLDWDPRFSLGAYEARSIAGARAALVSDATRRAWLETVAARLGSPQARALALKLIQRVSAADGTTDAEAGLGAELRALLAGRS